MPGSRVRAPKGARKTEIDFDFRLFAFIGELFLSLDCEIQTFSKEYMNVKIVNKSSNPSPSYATPLSAGMDIRANIDEPITLASLQRTLVPTGLYMALPAGYECQVRPRSGLAMKHGITVLNSPGTIDADYRGEIKVLLVNLSDKPFIIEPAERIAQLVVAKHEQVVWEEVEVLDDTDRGAGGFGSTGVK